MMGHQARSEALFYYFRLEDQIPENHLLRLIDKHVSFEFVGGVTGELLRAARLPVKSGGCHVTIRQSHGVF